MPTIVPKEERDLIINYFDSIPNPVWETLCDTDDRKEQFKLCQHWSLLLRSSFTAYFSGQAWELETDDKDFHDLFRLKFRRYLEIYNVIWHSWKHISESAHKIYEILPKPPNGKHPGSPGEMLMAIIEFESLGILASLFPEWRSGNFYESFSPRRSYERNRQFNKLKSKFIDTSIKPTELKELKKLSKQKKKDYRENFIFFSYTIICLGIARKHYQKGDNIERSLNEINLIESDIHRLELKTLHPRSKMPGYSVNKGVRGKTV